MPGSETLEQQNKELRLTLSKFAHEIRNPLALVSSELQIMAASHPELAACNDFDNIIENIDYMKQLLDELAAYNNARRLCLIPTNPAAYLRSLLAGVKPTLDYLGIKLNTDIPDRLPVIPLDQVKLRQALLNLLRNAQEAISGTDGIISVSASAVPRGIRIRIRDNGCGMDPEQLKNIFLPFITYKKDGTGLGLAITKQIIDAHKGAISVDSYPGRGTLFQIFLG